MNAPDKRAQCFRCLDFKVIAKGLEAVCRTQRLGDD